MYRLFSTHNVRSSISLPALWKLTALEEGVSFQEKVPVPSCIESIPSLSSYKGKCELQAKAHFGGNARLTFKGVSHTATVSLDGRPLGSHYGAYGEFSFVLKNIENNTHVISVITDNSYGEESSLHVENDYYSYNGITRPVLLEQLEQAYLQWMHITPILKDGHWQLEVVFRVENITEKPLSLTLKASLSTSDTIVTNEHSDQPLPSVDISDICLPAGAAQEYTCTMDCPDVLSYTPEAPEMYYLHALLQKDGHPVDDLIDRFGFRQVEVKGTDILWNGSPMRIKGFNRHEDYAEFGCSVPLTAMHRDIMLIKGTGANCIRTCHYPNDERFLDLCDEHGLFVWEEAHARGLSAEQMKNPNFDEQSALSVHEMITFHYNHPSIFVWGLLNECASDTEYGRRCYERLITQIRSLDSSRPVTFASCRFDHDICLDLVDIVSYNFYPGWYHKTPCSEFLAERQEVIHKLGGEGKPLIISEIGAGAIYGYRSNTNSKWTEDYQAEILREQIDAVLNLPGCSGVILWQYCDCRVDESWFSNRPKSQNNKGIVDMYRREKLGYYAVKEAFQK